MYGSRKYYYSKSKGYRYPITSTYGRPYKRRSGTTARSLGSARASKAGTKLDYFNCTVSGNCTFTRKKNENYSNVIAFYPCVGGVNPTTGIIADTDLGNVYGGLVNDRSFRLKCAQYDEVRLVSMKVKINMSNSEDGTMTLCSIADRDADRNEVEVDEAVMTDIESDTPSFREVCESQGSIKTIINKNRIYPVTRSIYARDLLEKSSYTDCTIQYNDAADESPLTRLTFENFPSFSPAIYFCIKFQIANTSADTPFTFGYTVEYNCIFRNPKSDLQTFVIKENPSYENPDSRSTELQKGITRIPSDNPNIPDIIAKDGKETNMSWLKRYIARSALKKVQHVLPSTERKISLVTIEEKQEEGTKEKPMEIEDDFGTA